MRKFDNLPTELLECICTDLPTVTLCALRATCKAFKVFVDDLKDVGGEVRVASIFPNTETGQVDCAGTPLQWCSLVPGGTSFDVPFTMDELEDPKSGLLFWGLRLSMVLIEGNDTQSSQFMKFFDRLLRFFEKHKVRGVKIRIDPVLYLGDPLVEFVRRVNKSTADLSVNVIFANTEIHDGDVEEMGEDRNSFYSTSELISLGPKFQVVKFFLEDDFNPAEHFQFTKNCDKLETLSFSSLSIDGYRLDSTPLHMSVIPAMFQANAVMLDMVFLEGLRLFVNEDLSKWGRLEMELFTMFGCRLYDDEDDDDLRDQFEAADGDWFGVGDEQESRLDRFDLVHKGFQCMAEKVVLEEQLPDILRAFRFPRLTELEVRNTTNPLYDHSIFEHQADFKRLESYLGPIDIDQPVYEAFEHLCNVKVLRILHDSPETANPSDVIESLVARCPKVKSIELIDCDDLMSTTYCEPDWREEISQPLPGFPIRTMMHSPADPLDMQMSVIQALQQAIAGHNWPNFGDNYDIHQDHHAIYDLIHEDD